MRTEFTILLITLLSFSALSQESSGVERYYFHVTVENPETLVISEADSNRLRVVNPNDAEETAIYATAGIYEFEPAFKTTAVDQLRNVFRVVTNSVEMLGQLLSKYPEKYSRIDQFYPDEAPFYPNDYGTTSPLENLGAEHPLHDLDLINAPGAWGITTGSPKVIIGISDSRIDSTHADMEGRVSKFLHYFTQTKGGLCAHGTNVAGIAIARANNAVGRPGICSDCDVVVNRYGDFKHVEELVAAGARVINTSWARCNMGPYHQNIEARINELYEDGIIIVAGAGNSKNCNRDDDYAPDDYAYPASYEKVISVTGVYTIYDKPEDNTYIGKEGRPTAGYLKDRHSAEYGVRPDGSLHPKYRNWDMQFNRSIDLCAPAQSYLLGHDICDMDVTYGGATSSAAPYITGVIGLMWSVNYCLDAYETESILKLTAAPIDHLPGNEFYVGQLGAGRVDAYKAVKMARDMKELMGKVEIHGRDFSRFDFRLKHAPYIIEIHNQTFRDSARVDFRARKRITLSAGTRLAPDSSGSILLGIDPTTSTAECFPEPVKEYVSVFEEEPMDKPKVFTIKKTFVVTADKSGKSVTVRPKIPNAPDTRGKKYSVTVSSPTKILMVKKEFNFPNSGVVEVEFGEYGYLTIEIMVDGQNELYRVKRP